MAITTKDLLTKTFSVGASEFILGIDHAATMFLSRGNPTPIPGLEMESWNRDDMVNIVLDFIADEELYSYFLETYQMDLKFIELYVEDDKGNVLITIFLAREPDGDTALNIQFSASPKTDDYIFNLFGVSYDR